MPSHELQDLVPEEQAASYAGVSVATLNRFAEAGYLRIEKGSDGGRFYLQSELANVFGINIIPGSLTKTSTPSGNGTTQPDKSRPSVDMCEKPKQKEQSSPLKDQEDEDSEIPSLSSIMQADRQQTSELSRQLARLKHLVELQEKLLEIKESQLKDLQEQRSWLKTRLERLEEKAERDQLLLLSETQTIRRLINMEEQRKSPLRLALEWLGFSTPESAKLQTIEVKSQAPAQAPDSPPGTPAS